MGLGFFARAGKNHVTRYAHGYLWASAADKVVIFGYSRLKAAAQQLLFGQLIWLPLPQPEKWVRFKATKPSIAEKNMVAGLPRLRVCFPAEHILSLSAKILDCKVNHISLC